MSPIIKEVQTKTTILLQTHQDGHYQKLENNKWRWEVGK